MPAAHIVAAEINPQVLAAAKTCFCLPPEDDQFSISIGDAAEYVAAHPATCDLLLCDGYDDGTLPPALSCESFYVSAAAALRGNGVLASNFLGRDRRLKTYLKRLHENFAESKRLDDGEDGNVVMLAFRRSVGIGSKGLQRRARQLEQRYGLPFTRYCEELAER